MGYQWDLYCLEIDFRSVYVKTGNYDFVNLFVKRDIPIVYFTNRHRITVWIDWCVFVGPCILVIKLQHTNIFTSSENVAQGLSLVFGYTIYRYNQIWGLKATDDAFRSAIKALETAIKPGYNVIKSLNDNTDPRWNYCILQRF